MSRAQVIDDEEHERIHDRVAAVDVAKDSGMVCTRTPHPSRPGARRSTVWTVKARMGTIRALGRQLKRDGIEIVTLESTSDYWRIWFFVLEACGLVVQLVKRPVPVTVLAMSHDLCHIGNLLAGCTCCCATMLARRVPRTSDLERRVMRAFGGKPSASPGQTG